MLAAQQIEEKLVALSDHRHDGSAAAAWFSRLDALLPQQSITINKFNETKRKIVNPGGDPFDYSFDLFPYLAGIDAAIDHNLVRIVAIKGNTRSGKTVSMESTALRNWSYGPMGNVIWFMQDEDSINDYIDERGDEMLRIHELVNEKIDWNDPKNGRKRKRIGRSLLLYRPATPRHTRGKAAPLIIADEIDAYPKRTRDAIMTLVTSRQEEFGNAAKAILGSHPDAGPDGGINQVLQDCLVHLWWVRCPHCGKASSPAAEAEVTGFRLNWNVPELMERAEEIPRTALLAHIAENVALVCPHDGCHATFSNDEERRALIRTGKWIQPHQKLLDDGTVEGEPRVSTKMGFVIHAFMAPFVKMRETAADWAAAKLTVLNTGANDTHLREVTVKKMGETYEGTKPEEQIEDARIVQQRLAASYSLRTVPMEVVFLTAFVDVQGDRFEVRVVGWDLAKQSWLIDAYAIKQWPAFGRHAAFDEIDPSNRLADWDVIEEAVLTASYPMVGNTERAAAGVDELFLPIARVEINSAGTPGVTKNARIWLTNLLSRSAGQGRAIEPFRVELMFGVASPKADTYGKAKRLIGDDGQPVPVLATERGVNVHEIKRIISKRMKIEQPGPGHMNLPSNLSLRYANELTAERMVNGKWVKMRRANETWDGWVACEVARSGLAPDRLAGRQKLPWWADPRPRAQVAAAVVVQQPESMFDRLAEVNRDVGG